MIKAFKDKTKITQIHKSFTTINKNTIKNYLNNNVTTKLSGKNPTTDIFLYTNQNPNIGPINRDSRCWLNGVKNIGCLCAAQLDGSLASDKLVTLISPKHVYLSNHYGPNGFGFLYTILSGGFFQAQSKPAEILFVNGNNETISRKIIKGMYASDHWNTGPNSIGQVVGLLDEEVPPDSFPFAKVLPPNFQNYFAFTKNIFEGGTDVLLSQDQFYTVTTTRSITINNQLYEKQTVVLGKFNKVYFENSYPFFPDTTIAQQNNYMYISSYMPSDALSAWFASTGVQLGDSGRPIFVIIDNELVLLGIWQNQEGGDMISSSSYYNSTNRAMQKLGGGYELTPINLEYFYNTV